MEELTPMQRLAREAKAGAMADVSALSPPPVGPGPISPPPVGPARHGGPLARSLAPGGAYPQSGSSAPGIYAPSGQGGGALGGTPAADPEQVRRALRRFTAVRGIVVALAVATAATAAFGFSQHIGSRPSMPPGGTVAETTVSSVEPFGPGQVVRIHAGGRIVESLQQSTAFARGDWVWASLDETGSIDQLVLRSRTPIILFATGLTLSLVMLPIGIASAVTLVRVRLAFRAGTRPAVAVLRGPPVQKGAGLMGVAVYMALFCGIILAYFVARAAQNRRMEYPYLRVSDPIQARLQITARSGGRAVGTGPVHLPLGISIPAVYAAGTGRIVTVRRKG